MGVRLTALTRQPDFLKLWGGQTVSRLGSEVTLLAIPLTAAFTLGAGPAQMGLLEAAQFSPFLFFGLFAGVWVDRLPRRPVLIAADLGRAALLASVPVASLLGVLGLGYLYAVAFLVGTLTVLFDVGYLALLPALIRGDQLLEANGKLEASRSAAHIAGPALGGELVQLITAPVAVLVDAVSFVISAVFLVSIGEPPAPVGAQRRGLWHEAIAGLRVVLDTPAMRAIGASLATFNLFANAFVAVYILYVTRQLHLGPAALGLTVATGGGGALAGALIAAPVARRIGVGGAAIAAIVVAAISTVLVALADGPPVVLLTMLAIAQVLSGLASLVLVVNIVSFRQAITPPGLQGRISATMRFCISGTLPLGALLGGFLGQAIGLRATVLVAAAGQFLACLWLIVWPLREARVVAEV